MNAVSRASTIVLALVTAMFGLHAWLVVSQSSFVDVDTQVANYFLSVREPFLDKVMTAITLTGDTKFLILAFSISGLLFWRSGRGREAVIFVSTGILLAILVFSLKDVFGIARPDVVLHPPESGSFPSGHSAGAVTYLGLMAMWVLPRASRVVHLSIITIAFVLSCLVCLSRMYLGVHWLSDVIGGVILGIWLISSAQLCKSIWLPKDSRVLPDTIMFVRPFVVIWLIYAIFVFRESVMRYGLAG